MTTIMTNAVWANPWRVAGWTMAALLLALPLVAMQFTTEVNWTTGDFVFAAGMIGGVGLVLELIVRRSRDRAYRAGAVLALAAMFLLIWINAAVGIIGGERNPLNLFYGVVIAMVLAGAIGAGFRAGGMARTMLAAAAAMVPIGLVAVIAAGAAEPPGAAGLALLNGGFAAMFAGAAALFRHAAHGGG